MVFGIVLLAGCDKDLIGIGIENRCAFAVEVRTPSALNSDWRVLPSGEAADAIGVAGDLMADIEVRTPGGPVVETTVTATDLPAGSGKHFSRVYILGPDECGRLHEGA